MTIKPPRTKLEREQPQEKIRLLRREAQEREARRALKDFLRHREEDEEKEYERNVTPPKI